MSFEESEKGVVKTEETWLLESNARKNREKKCKSYLDHST